MAQEDWSVVGKLATTATPGGDWASVGKLVDDWSAVGSLPTATAKKPEGGFAASAKNMVGQTIAGVGRAVGDFTPGVSADNAVSRYGQGLAARNPTAVNSFSDFAAHPWEGVKEAVGNMAPSMAGVVGSRVVGSGITAAAPLVGAAFPPAAPISVPLTAGLGQAVSWLGPLVTAAAPSYEGIRRTQIEADPKNEGDTKSKMVALGGAAAVGAIENRFGPQEWATRALTKEGRESLAKTFAAKSLPGAIGSGIVRGAAIEGAEELVQNPIEQLAGYQNPLTAENLKDTAFSGFMGAVGGGVAGGGTGGAHHVYSAHQQKVFKSALDSAHSVLIDPEAPYETRMQAATFVSHAMADEHGDAIATPWYESIQESLVQDRDAQQRAQEEGTAAEPAGENYGGLNIPRSKEYKPQIPLAGDEEAVTAGDEWRGVKTIQDEEASGVAPVHLVGGTGVGETVISTDNPYGYVGNTMHGVVRGEKPAAVATATSTATQAAATQAKTTPTGPAQAGLDLVGGVAPTNILQPAPVAGETLTPRQLAYGTEKAAGQAEMFGSRGGVLASAVAPAAPKPQKLSAASARLESIFQEHLAAGTITPDHPLVQAWNASPKLAQDAIRIGKEMAKAVMPQAPVESKAAPVPQRTAETGTALVLPRNVTLTAKQQPIFDHIRSAVDEHRLDDIVDAQGVLQYQKIADAFGLERGSAKSFIDGVARRIAVASGHSIAEFKQALKDRAVAMRTTEESDQAQRGLSPALQAQTANESDYLGGEETEPSMGVINSIGGSQSEAGNDEAPPNYVDSVAPSDNAKAAALANRQAALAEATQLLSEPEAVTAALDYNDARSEGSPAFEELTPLVQAQFVSEYLAQVGVNDSWDSITALQQDFERRLEPDDVEGTTRELQDQSAPEAVQGIIGASREDARVDREGPAASGEAPINPLEARLDRLKEFLGGKQNLAVKKWIERYSNGDINLERLVGELENYEEQVKLGVRFSLNDTTERGTEAKTVAATLSKLFFSPAKFRSLVTVVQSHTELPASVKDAAAQAASMPTSEVPWDQAQGFVVNGKVYMIADNLVPGQELSVFLHEVGVHLGMEKLIGKANMARLAGQINTWAAKNDGSQESVIAKAALERIPEGTDASLQGEESIAYFIEEAVKAGIDPQAIQKINSPLAQWFRNLWAAAKVALRKMGLQRFDQLTAQNLVDLAYGSAKMELTGTWHGTAADFRNFDHAFMNSGEGAQAFGWGSYLAQRPGVAKGYWKDDVRRKQNGGSEYAEVALDGIPLKELFDLDTDAFYFDQMDELSAMTPQQLKDHVLGQVLRGASGDTRLAYANSQAKQDEIDTLKRAYNRMSKADPSMFAVVKNDPVEGSLMRVDTAVHDDEMLDWDKPLSEQSDVVKLALDGAGIVVTANDNGQDAYREIERRIRRVARNQNNDFQKAASEYLDSIGIKGIKFLDQVSRSNATVDFVNFPRHAELVAAMKADDFFGFDSRPEMRNEIINDPNWAERYETEHGELYNAMRDWYMEQKQADKTRNLVIFNDKNIQRVMTEVAASPDRIKFSVAQKAFNASPTPAGMYETILSKVHDLLLNPVEFAKVHGLGWYTLEQMAERFKSTSVRTYSDVMTQMQKFSKDRVYEASQIDRVWAKLDDKMQARLSDVMRAATRESFDPSKDKPENAKQQAILSQYSALSSSSNGKIGAKEIYAQVRDYYEQNFALKKEILLDAANKAKAAGHNTAEVDKMFSKLKGPYFPLMRIGSWYSVGMSNEVRDLMQKKEDGTLTPAETKELETLRKDPKHYVTRGHSSRAEAVKSERELKALLGNAKSNKSQERIGNEVHQMPDLQKVEAYIATDLPAESRRQVKEMMAQMYFDMLPESSALKRQMKREGVHGEEQNMRRVFAASAISSAHHIGRLKYANDLSAAMVDVANEGRKSNDNSLYNELVKRSGLALQQDSNPVVDRILQTSYFAHLGLSPAFILTNMTQVPMITLPWLGARHSFGTASRAITAAYADVFGIIKTTYTKGDWRSELNWSEKFAPGSAEDKLLHEMLDRNLLDITMEHDLGAVAEMRNGKVDDYIKMANLPVHVTELANRAVTALAAYRLGLAKGMDHDKAVQHAADAISDTQLNYSGLNAPRHMQSVLGSKAIARLMFQFRKYQQGMLYLVGKSVADSVRGESETVRREARRTLFGLFATTGLTAGALGLPAMGSLTWLATTIVGLIPAALGGSDGDDPFNAEVELRNLLADMFGAQAAAVVAKGLPTLVGLDLSNRIGMGDIGSPLPFARQGKTGTEKVGNTLAAVAGAGVGTMATMYDGIHELGQGNVAKGAEKIVPVKLAQNLIRSYRYDTEGLTDKRGDVILPAEKFSGWDLILRANGFQPTKESEYYAANQAVQEAKVAARDTRAQLLNKYSQARLAGEDTSDIQEKIQDFNSRHPQAGQRINAESLHKSVALSRKQANQRNETGVIDDKHTRPFIENGRFSAP